jgi:hypothetical protein
MVKPVIKVKVKTFGIESTSNFLSSLQQQLPEVVSGVVEDIANDVVEGIKSNIENQSYKHKPLTPNYKRYKILHGLDSRILIRTKFYLNKINVFSGKIKNEFLYHIGVSKLEEYSDGKKLYDIAKWLEYGTTKMVARPIYAPELKNIKENLSVYIKFINGKIGKFIKISKKNSKLKK